MNDFILIIKKTINIIKDPPANARGSHSSLLNIVRISEMINNINIILVIITVVCFDLYVCNGF